MKNVKKASIFYCLLFPLLVAQGISQNVQKVRGRVVDKVSQVGLPGVNVVISDNSEVFGTATDIDGYYILEGVPIGRHTVEFSFIGYHNALFSNIDVLPGKQAVVNVELEEQVTKVDEVVVAAIKKSESLNKMATVSVRTFSLEESERYAGSLGDVSRMATNFAGVQTANDAVNEIVIRGNAPGGLLWRLDGINIPNPNHFGSVEATAGPVSMLNKNVLSNSDFFTGAFPSEYGNATSGVFDLRMRKGNSEDHEFLAQVGFGGFEAGAEGPLAIGERSSYLVNYRYSTLAVMALLGMPMQTGTAIPYYQDLSAKFTVPTKKAGTFSLIALGGYNYIDFVGSDRDTSNKDEELNLYQEFESDLLARNNLGVLGLTHKYIFSQSVYTKVIFAGAHTYNGTEIDSIGYFDRTITPWYRGNYYRNNLQCNLFVNVKVNAKNSFRVGSDNDLQYFSIHDSIYSATDRAFRTLTHYDGQLYLLQPYVTWQYKFSDDITLNAGVHGQYLSVNSASSIEPRVGLKWQFLSKDRLTLGIGMHSQSAPASVYMAQVQQADGTYSQPNKDLGFIRSNQYVVGYEHDFERLLRFKTEVYYQQITDALVDVKPNSYSYLNAGSMTYSMPDSVENGGSGYNYGIEFTVEKFMHKGFYLLNTVSLYDSRYKGSDGVEHNTAYNGGYVVNILVGKEFTLPNKKGKKTRKAVSLDGKLNYAGGKRYSPVDYEESALQQTVVYDDSRAYENQLNDYIRCDIRIGYKLMSKRMTQEFGLDLQNVLNRKNEIGMRYDIVDKKVEKQYQLAFQPMMLYRIVF